MGDITRLEQNSQAAAQVSIANAVSSLRQLTFIDRREVFERHSVVEKMLRADLRHHPAQGQGCFASGPSPNLGSSVRKIVKNRSMAG